MRFLMVLIVGLFISVMPARAEWCWVLPCENSVGYVLIPEITQNRYFKGNITYGEVILKGEKSIFTETALSLKNGKPYLTSML